MGRACFCPAIKMKISIAIVTLALASDFISLVIGADLRKNDTNLEKKPFNFTQNSTISNSNSTLNVGNSTLLSKIENIKNSTSKFNERKNVTNSIPKILTQSSTIGPSLKIDRKVPSNKSNDIVGKSRNNVQMKLNVDSANKIANNKTDTVKSSIKKNRTLGVNVTSGISVANHTLGGRNNATTVLKNATIEKNDHSIRKPTLKVPHGALDNSNKFNNKTKNKTKISTSPMEEQMKPTTETVKVLATPLNNGRQTNATIKNVKKDRNPMVQHPNLMRPNATLNDSKRNKSSEVKLTTTTERINTSIQLPKIERPVNPAILKNNSFNLNQTTAFQKPTVKLPMGKSNKTRKAGNSIQTTNSSRIVKMTTAAERVKPWTESPSVQRPSSSTPAEKEKSKNIDNISAIVQKTISKLPIDLIVNKMKPPTATTTTERVKSSTELPRNRNTEKPTADSDKAIDDAWKIVKEKKYDNLDKKTTLPKYEIPAKDLENVENSNGKDQIERATNKSAPLKEAVAREVKEQMIKYEMDKAKQTECISECTMSRWKIVAMTLLPMALLIVVILLFISIRKRMNAAKGRSFVYELTSDLGKKNNEKPVIST